MNDYELADALMVIVGQNHGVDEETADVFKDYLNDKEKMSLKELCEQLLKIL